MSRRDRYDHSIAKVIDSYDDLSLETRELILQEHAQALREMRSAEENLEDGS